MKKRIFACILGVAFSAQVAAAGFPFQPNQILNAADLNAALQTAAITGGNIGNVNLTNALITNSIGTFTSLTSPSVALTGGLINGVPIGTTNPSTGFFSTISSSGVVATGPYSGPFTDGVILDYAPGNGRLSVGAGDVLSVYNGGIGNVPLAQFSNNTYGLLIQPALTSTGASVYGEALSPTGNVNNTGAIIGSYSAPNTPAAVFTVGTLASYQAFDGVKGAGSVVTSDIGFISSDRSNGIFNYGFWSGVMAGTNKWAFYNAGTAPSFTGTTYVNSIFLSSSNSILITGTAPTVNSGFGTGASIPFNNGAAAFEVNVGTGGTASSGVIGFSPAATHGWTCAANDETTTSATVFMTKQTSSTTSSVTITNFNNTGAAAAWVASDVVHMSCFAY